MMSEHNYGRQIQKLIWIILLVFTSYLVWTVPIEILVFAFRIAVILSFWIVLGGLALGSDEPEGAGA